MRISSWLKWITEYLVCLLSYYEADLLGLSVFGVKNRIVYEFAQVFCHNAYFVLFLQLIRFSVQENLILVERFFYGRIKRVRELFVVLAFSVGQDLWAVLCPAPQYLHKSVSFLQLLISQSGPAHRTHFFWIAAVFR